MNDHGRPSAKELFLQALNCAPDGRAAFLDGTFWTDAKALVASVEPVSA